MGEVSRIADRLSRVLAVLTVIALALRFALPAGAMLAKPVEEGALPSIVVCTSAGMVEVATKGDYGVPADKPAKKDANSGEPCVFASVGAPLLVPSFSLDGLEQSAVAVLEVWGYGLQRPGEGLAAPPPPATGPPAAI
jgi:hypothetical protein